MRPHGTQPSGARGANRTYRAEDPEGHQWWFMARVLAPKTAAT